MEAFYDCVSTYYTVQNIRNKNQIRHYVFTKKKKITSIISITYRNLSVEMDSRKIEAKEEANILVHIKSINNVNSI